MCPNLAARFSLAFARADSTPSKPSGFNSRREASTATCTSLEKACPSSRVSAETCCDRPLSPWRCHRRQISLASQMQLVASSANICAPVRLAQCFHGRHLIYMVSGCGMPCWQHASRNRTPLSRQRWMLRESHVSSNWTSSSWQPYMLRKSHASRHRTSLSWQRWMLLESHENGSNRNLTSAIHGCSRNQAWFHNTLLA